MSFTRISSIAELKNLLVETLLNKTDKVTKISDQSILNGVAYGVGKIGQKAQKDIALVESQLFVEGATGANLDIVAERNGVTGRFGASGSSAYVKIIAQPGTVYTAATNIFSGQGVNFELTEDITIGSSGFGYFEVRSQSTGSKTNIPSLTINTVTSPPAGHVSVTNEYRSTGGRDVEGDELFQRRIKNSIKVATRGTLDYITQVLQQFNSNILQAHSYGRNEQGQNVLAITTQNGASFTQDELDQLLDNIKSYLPINEYNGLNNATLNTVLVNAEYEYIDIDFRAELIQTANVDSVRRDIQVAISKYLDFRYWSNKRRVEWDDLLSIVKKTSGVKQVADSHFKPKSDIEIDITKLVRIRGFVMRDLNGNVMIDNGGVLSPVFYPNEINADLKTVIEK